LYASFAKNVGLIFELGLAALNRSIAALRIGSPGSPLSDQ
jgi:hypothetical protein